MLVQQSNIGALGMLCRYRRVLLEHSEGCVLRNGLLQCFGTFKIPLLMFISILVFRPEGQIWNPVRRDTRIYVRRILNASRISKTQLNSCTISPS